MNPTLVNPWGAGAPPAGGGSGTVTNTGGALTSGQVMIGNGGNDAAVTSGQTFSGTVASFTDTTDASSLTTAGVKFAGGIAVTKKIYAGDLITVLKNAVNPSAIGGTLLHLVNADANNNIILSESTGGVASMLLYGRVTGGTAASPSATSANNVGVNLAMLGYANGALTTSPSARIRLLALNSWTGSDQSTQIDIGLTPSGSTTLATAYTLQVGSFSIAAATSGSLIFAPAAATAQNVTIATAAQTVGASTLTLPDMAGTSDTFAFLGKAQTFAGATVFSSTLSVTGNFGVGQGAAAGVVLTSGGTVTSANAASIQAVTTLTATGNGTNYYGYYSAPTFATVTFTGGTAYGINLTTPSVTGSGNLATSYQLYISAGATATTKYGIFQVGTDPNSFAGSVSAVGVTNTGVTTLTPAASASSRSYFVLTVPTDTAQTAATESIGFKTVTATRTWAATGTVALQRENYFAGVTYASASASQTFTDITTLYVDRPLVGSNAIFTRAHSLTIVDSTSAASAITGGFVIATTLGTAATSVGIGGGNINAGGTITSAGAMVAGTTFTATGGASSLSTTTINGATAATALTITNIARTSGVLPYIKWTIPTDTGQTASTESPGVQVVTGTRTWATTGTVALQREIFFAGPTYASASASQTFTDACTLYITPPVAGSNAIFTRGHSLVIVDATSAASAITGGLVIATTLGTAATSVGIGGGNINCGGTLTTGGAITSGSSIQTAAGVTNGAGVWKLGALRTSTALTASTTNVIQIDVGGTLYSLMVCSTNP